LQHIARLLEMDWEVTVCHSYHEANKCVDALANMGCDGGEFLIIYEHCPTHVRHLLLADIVGVSTPRLIKL